MKTKLAVVILLGVIVTSGSRVRAQGPPEAPPTGPGVQAAQDAREPDVLKTCKTPPPAAGAFRFPPAPPARDYTVTAIPGVISAGEKWEEVWHETGNNDDGIIPTPDGGVLIAQNDKSDVVKVDKDRKISVVYSETNTGGALSMSKKGTLFLASRGLNAKILELSPKRRVFADKFQGESFDCIGGVLNDVMGDSKGGVYFTQTGFTPNTGGLFYADSKGVVKQYGTGLRTNGLILSPDEKTLYVTNGPSLAAFDVQPDGSLVNQRDFVKWDGGPGDGSAVDSTGRIYVTTGEGVRVIGSDGKYLGLIPSPRPLVTVTFGGPDKKLLYAAEFYNEAGQGQLQAPLVAIHMIAKGYTGRAK